MPVVINETPDTISLFQWGLIPFWVKNLEQANSLRQRTLNARSETIFVKPAFRHSVRSKRCLVIVDGFYEWRHVGKKRYPYYITLKNRPLFALAGIWDSWTDHETKDNVNTFAVVTTEANELMSKVHNSRKRMPLILPKERHQDWLDVTIDEITIRGIMKPYDPIEMEVDTVVNKLYRLGYNTTDRTITEPFDYPELPALD